MGLKSSRGCFRLLGGRCIRPDHPHDSRSLPDSYDAPAVIVGLVSGEGSIGRMPEPSSPAPGSPALSSSGPPSVNAEEVIIIEDSGEDWPPIEWMLLVRRLLSSTRSTLSRSTRPSPHLGAL